MSPNINGGAGSSEAYQGIVVVANATGHIGLACGDRWTMKEAGVACTQVGHFGGAIDYDEVAFASTLLPMAFTQELKCNGSEAALGDCQRRNTSTSRCSKAVKVTCRGKTILQVAV